MSALLAPVLCLLTLTATSAQEVAQEPALDPVARLAAELGKREGLMGGAIAYVQGDGEVRVHPFGVVEPEGRAITAEDRFCAGSVGKTFFVGLALHHLASGELELEAKVSRYLDEETLADVPNGADLTIHQLLRHQTGLPRYIEDPRFWTDLNAEPEASWAPGSQLKYVRGKQPVHPAGEGWAYSDTNYVLLAMVLEQLEGRSAYEAIAARVLKPHGLTQTLGQTQRKLPGLVQGHTALFQSMGLPARSLGEDGLFSVNPSFEYGGGGYVSSPGDLARWARILWSGAAIEDDYLEVVLDAVDAPMLRGRYGLGVILRDTPAGKVRAHDGIFVGYLSAMGYFPERDLAVAIQINQDNGRPVGKPLHAILADVALALALEDK